MAYNPRIIVKNYNESAENVVKTHRPSIYSKNDKIQQVEKPKKLKLQHMDYENLKPLKRNKEIRMTDQSNQCGVDKSGSETVYSTLSAQSRPLSHKLEQPQPHQKKVDIKPPKDISFSINFIPKTNKHKLKLESPKKKKTSK